MLLTDLSTRTPNFTLLALLVIVIKKAAICYYFIFDKSIAFKKSAYFNTT